MELSSRWVFLLFVTFVYSATFNWKAPYNDAFTKDGTWDIANWPGKTAAGDTAVVKGVSSILNSLELKDALAGSIHATVEQATFVVSKGSTTLGTTSVNNDGTLKVEADISATSLSVLNNGVLELKNGKTITLTGAGTFNSGSSFTATSGTGNLVLSGGGLINLKDGFVLNANTIKTGGKIVETFGAVSMSAGATVNGAGKLQVGSGSTFTLNGGTLLVAIEGAGDVHMKNNAGDGTRSFTNTGGNIAVTSTSNEVTLDFSSFDFSTSTLVTTNCDGNDITFSTGTVDTGTLNVLGTSGCIVDMNLVGIAGPGKKITVDAATLKLANSARTISAAVEVSNGGQLNLGNALNTLSETMTIKSGAAFVGTPKITLTNAGTLNLNTNQDVNLVLDSTTGGKLNIDDTTSTTKVTLSGGSTMKNTQKWSFANCQSIDVTRNWNVQGTVEQKCATTLDSVVTSSGGGLFDISAPLTISGTLINSGSVSSCSNTKIDVTGTLTSGSSLSLDNCKLNNGGAVTFSTAQSWTKSDVNLNSGSFDYRGVKVTMNDGSSFAWNGGSLSTDSSSELTLSKSSLVLGVAGSISGSVSLDTDSTLTSTKNVELKGVVSLTDTTVDISNGMKFSGSSLTTAGTTDVTHSGGALVFGATTGSLGGSWKSTGGSVSIPSGDVTIPAGATFDATGASLTLGDTLIVRGGAKFSANSPNIQSGSTLRAINSDTVVTLTGNAKVAGTVNSRNSGLITFSQFVDGQTGNGILVAQNKGVIELGGGTFDGSITAKTLGEIAVTSGKDVTLTGTTTLDEGYITIPTGTSITLKAGANIGVTDSGTIDIDGTMTIDKDFTAEAGLSILGSGSLICNDKDDFSMENSATVSLNGGTFQLLGTSNLKPADKSVISVIDGNVKFARQDITFDKEFLLEIGGTEFTINGLVMNDDSDIDVVSGTSTITGSRSINLNDESSITVDGSSTVLNIERSTNLNSESSVIVTNGAKLTLTGNTMTVKDSDAKVSVSGGATFEADNGEFDLADGDFILDQSHIVVNNEFGVFNEMVFRKGSTTVLRGSSSTATGSGRILLEKGAKIKIKDGCTINHNKSPFVNNGAEVDVDLPITLSNTERSFTTGCEEWTGAFGARGNVDISDGSHMKVVEEGCWKIINSDVFVRNSIIELDDNGLFELNFSDMLVTDSSDFLTNGNSRFFMHSGSRMVVDSKDFKILNSDNATQVNMQVSGSTVDVRKHLTIGGDTLALFDLGSSLIVASGVTLSVSGSSQLDIIGSTGVTVAGSITVESQFNMDASTLTMTGAFTSQSSGTPTFTKSTVSITDADMSVKQTSITKITDSTNVSLLGASNLIVSDTAVTEINKSSVSVAGNALLTTDSTLNVLNGAVMSIAGASGLQASGSSDIVVDASTLNLQANTMLQLIGSSTMNVDNGATVNFASGSISLQGTASLVVDGSTLDITTGSITVKDDTTMSVLTTSTLGLGAATLSIKNTADLVISNNKKTTVSSSASFTDTATGTITGSVIDVTGLLSLADSADLKLVSGATVNLLNGNTNIEGSSQTTMNGASVFNVQGGKLSTKGTSVLNIQGASTVAVTSNEFSIEGDSTVNLSEASTISVGPSGPLNLRETSFLSITKGTLDIQGGDVTMLTSSELSTSGANSLMRVTAGGSVEHYNFAHSTIKTNSKFDIQDGSSYCTNNAMITLENNGQFLVSATSTADFEGKCILEMKPAAVFTSQGVTTFEGDTKLTMNNAMTSLFNTATFQDNFQGEFIASSTLNIEGTLNLLGPASISLDQSILDVKGAFVQSGSGVLTGKTTSAININGDFTQLGSVAVNLISSDLNVKGTVSSSNVTTLGASAGSKVSISSGAVGLNNDVEWVFDSSTFRIENSGSFTQKQFAKTSLLSTSDLTLDNGSIFLETDSEIFTSESTIDLLSGGLSAKHTSLLHLTQDSVFTVTGGDIVFCDSSEFIIDGTSSFIVNGGSVIIKDNAAFTPASGAVVQVNGGSFQIQDSTCPVIDGGDFDVDGNFHLGGQSCLLAQNSTFDITGELATFDDHKLTVLTSDMQVDNGLVLFSGTAVSSVTLNTVTLGIKSGVLIVNETATIDITNTDISIDFGSATFGDSSVNLFSNSDITITSNGQLSFIEASNTNVKASNILVTDGTLTMESDIFIHSNSDVSVDQGGIVIQDAADFDMKDSSLVLMVAGTGKFEVFDTSAVDLVASSLTIHAGNLEFNEASTFFAKTTPIQVNGGSALFTSTTTSQFITSSFEVNGGDYTMDLSSTLDADFTPFRINAGNFYAKDNTNLDLNVSPLFVSGNVAFSEFSNLDILDSSVNVFGGDFSTADVVTITLVNSPLTVEGDVILSGATHHFQNSPILVAKETFTGKLEANLNAMIQAIDSPITVNGDVAFNDDSYLLAKDSSISVSKGNVVFSDDSVVEFQDSTTLTINTGNFEMYDRSNLLAGSTSITVTAGNFRGFDDVSLDWVDIDLFVGGSVSFTNQSQLILDQSDVNIVGGIFFTQLLADLTLKNTNLHLEGALVLEGENHLFEDSVIDIVDSKFVGILQAAKNALVTMNRTNTTLYDGDLFLAGNAKLVTQDSAIVLNSGNMVFSKSSQIDITDTNIEVTGNFILDTNSKFNAATSTVDIISGNFEMFDDAILDFDTVDLSITGNAKFIENVKLTMDKSSVEVIGGKFTSFDNVALDFTETPLHVEGTVSLGGGNHDFKDGKIDVINGAFKGLFEGRFNAQVHTISNPLTIDGGNMEFSSKAYMLAENSDIVVKTGNMIFKSDSTLELALATALTIEDGNFELRGNARFLTTTSTVIAIDGGDFLIFDDIDLTFDGITLSVGGNIEFVEQSKMTILNSQVNVVGGSLSTALNAAFAFYDTSLLVEGSVLFSGKTHYFEDSSIDIIDGIALGVLQVDTIASVQTLRTPITIDGGNMIFKDSSKLTTEDSALLITDGSAIFSNSSKLDFQIDTSLTIQNGNLDLKNNAVLTGISSTLDVFGGDLRVYDKVSIDMTDIALHVGGGVQMTSTSKMNLKDSSVDVINGVFSTDNSVTLNFATTNLLVEGSVVLNGKSHLFTDSTINVSDSSFVGVLEANKNSQVTFIGSTATVDGGDILFTTTSKLTSKDSDIVVDSGNMLFSDKSVLAFSGLSTVTINSGNFELHDQVTFGANDTSIDVDGGNFQMFNTASLTFSVVDLTVSGNTHFAGSSKLSMAKSSVDVIGGTFSTADNTVMSFSQTPLSVDGNVDFSGRNQSFVDSSISVLNGLFESNLAASTSALRTPITVDGGNIEFTQNSKLVADGSDVLLKNGNVIFSNSSLLQFKGSTKLTIETGNFDLLNNARFLAASTSIDVLGGDFRVFDDVALDLLGIDMFVGGNMQFTQAARMKLTNSSVDVVDGSLSTANTASLNFMKTPLLVQGSVVLEGSIHSFTDSLIKVESGSVPGVFQGNMDAIALVVRTPITIDGGNMEFKSQGHLLAEDSDLLIKGGSVIFSADSLLEFAASTSLKIETGNFDLRNNAKFIADSTKIDVLNGDFRVYDDVDLDLSAIDMFVGGNMQFTKQSSLTMTGSSVDVVDGIFSTADSSSLLFLDTPLLVEGTVSVSGALHYFEDSAIIISSGTLPGVFQANIGANVTAVRTPITVDGGNMEFYDNTYLLAEDSNLLVKDGSVIFSNSAILQFSQLTTLNITNGNFDLQDEAQFLAQSSSIDILGGSFRVFDDVNLDLHEMDLFVGGNALFSQNTTLKMTDSSVDVIDGIFSTSDSVEISFFDTPLLVRGSVTLGGSSHHFEDSSIHVDDGNVPGLFETSLSSKVTSVRTNITIDNGNMEFKNSSSFSAQESNMIVNIGSVIFTSATTVEFSSDTSLILTGGNFDLHQNSQFDADGSAIDVQAGDLRVYDDVVLDFSRVDLDVGGNVQFSEQSRMNIDDSSVDVIGGTLSTAHSAQFSFVDTPLLVEGTVLLNGVSHQFDNSPITISEFFGPALFQANGNSQVRAVDSPITMESGDIQFNNSTHLLAENSNIVVNEGSVVFANTAVLEFTQDTSLTINGGNFDLHNNAQFEATATSVSVLGGNFRVYDSVALAFEIVELLVEGNVELVGDSQLSMANSEATVSEGKFTTSDNVNVDFTDTPLIVEGSVVLNGVSHSFTESPITVDSLGFIGFQANLDALVTALNSPVLVNSGDFDFNNNTKFIATDSELTINDGNVDFAGASQLLATESDVTVNGGGVTFTETSYLSASDSDMIVNGGSVDFSGTSILEFLLSTSLTINNGNFTLRETSQMKAGSTTIDIFDGNFRVLDQVNLDFDSVDIFVGGNAEFTNDASLTMANADIKVVGGNLSTANNVELDFTNTPVFVQGDMILSGVSHSFEDSPITVQSAGFTGFQANGDTFVSAKDSPVVIDSGDFMFNNNAQLTATDSSITVNAGNVDFNDASELHATDSDITINDGSLDFSGTSILNFILSTALTINDGNFDLRNSSQMIAANTTVDIFGGKFRVHDQVDLDFDQVDVFVSGNAEFTNDASLSIKNAEVDVIGGTFVTEHNVVLDFTNTPLLVQGDVALNGQSHSFQRSPITVQAAGFAGFQANADSMVTATDSPIVIESGDFLFGNNAQMVATTSSITLNDGGIAFNAQSAIQADDSAITVNDGSVQFSGSAQLQASNSDLLVNDGSVDFSGTSILEFLLSTSLTINNGNFTLRETSQMKAGSTTVDIFGGNFRVLDQVNLDFDSVDIFVGGNAEFTNDASLTMANAKVDVIGGNFVTENEVILDFTNTPLLVQGDVTLNGQSHSFQSSPITVQSAGFTGFQANENSLVSAINSPIVIESGDFDFSNNAELFATNSAITLNTGSITFGVASELHASDSDLLVNNGSVLFSGSSVLEFLLSTTLTINNGNFTLRDTSTMIAASTTIAINEGTFRVANQVDLDFDAVDIFVGGNAQFVDSAKLTMKNAEVDVIGGNFSTENNVVLDFTNTPLLVEGDVTLSGQSHSFQSSPITVRSSGFTGFHGSSNAIVSTSESPIVIESGDFTFVDSSQLIASDSDITVNAGSVDFSGNAILEFLLSTSLTIRAGDFTLRETSQMLASSTTIDVLGGNLNLLDQVDLDFNAVDILVAGNVIFSGSAIMRSVNSDIDVLEGSFTTSDNSTIHFSDGNVNIVAGSFTTSGNAQVEFINNSLQVEGTVIFDGSSSSRHYFEDSEIVVRDSPSAKRTAGAALLETNEEACVIALRTTVSVFSGNVVFNNESCLQGTQTNMLVSDGSVTFFDDSSFDFSQSSLQIDAGNFDLNDLTVFQAENANLTVNGGHFRVFDFVDLDFTAVDLLVGGNVEFWGNSLLSMLGSTIRVNGGTLSSRDNVDIQLQDGSVVVTDGDFTTAHNVTMNLRNNPLRVQGNVFFSGTSNSVYHFEDSAITVEEASGPAILQATEEACITIIRSPVTILSGSIDFNANSCLTATTSPIVIQSGNFHFSESAVFDITDAETSLTIYDGSFELSGTAQFNAPAGITVDVFGGNFIVRDFTSLDLVEADLFVGGNVLFSETASFQILRSVLDVDGGSIRATGDVNMQFLSSEVSVVNGELVTAGSVDFGLMDSSLHVGGDVRLSGDETSQFTFTESTFEIVEGGDMVLDDSTSLTLTNTTGTILGGSLDIFDNGEFISDASHVTLDGTGTLAVHDFGHVVLDNQSSFSVLTTGSTVSFEESANLEIFNDSTFTLTDGSILFDGLANFDLWDGSNINILGGSFAVAGNATMFAHPNTDGTIVGGNFHVRDHANVTFLSSNIRIIGGLNSTSSIPVQFINGSTLVITGDPLIVAADAVLQVLTGTRLEVIDGSIILYDNASILSNESFVSVTNGSIIANDNSAVIATSSSEFIVTNGGNVTIQDSSAFSVTHNSTLTVSSSGTGTEGSVFVFHSGEFLLEDESTLIVDGGGNLVVADSAQFTSSSDTTIRLIHGDVIISDSASFSSHSNSLLEILEGGNFVACGEDVVLTFNNARTVIDGGDFTTCQATSLSAISSLFDILGSGNVVFDGSSVSSFTQSEIDVHGGGNVELVDLASLFLDDSSITVRDTGSIIGSGVSSLEMTNGSVLQVLQDGLLSFTDNALFVASGGSIAEVSDGSSILFEGSAGAQLTELSQLFVQGGGNIVFSDSSSLHAVQSELSVLGGGDIQFNGSGTMIIENESSLLVNGGNIEYHDDRIINLTDSVLSVSSGDLQTFGNTIFNLISSDASISGGNFVLNENSQVNSQDGSVVTISAGNLIANHNSVLNTQENALLAVTGGHVALYDSATLNTQQGSSVVVSSGHLSLHGESGINAEDTTSMIVSGGDVSLHGGSFVTMNALSTMDVSSGNINLFDSSIVRLTSSAISVSGVTGENTGHFETNNSSRVEMTTGSISITGGDFITSGTSSVTVSELSALSISSGSFVSSDFASVNLITSSLDVSGGTLTLTNQSTWNSSNSSTTTVSGGDVLLLGNSAMNINESSFAITNGNLNLDQQSDFVFASSVLLVEGGNVNFIGESTIQGLDSQFSVTCGRIVYDNASEFIVENTHILLDGGECASISNRFVTNPNDDDLIFVAGFAKFISSRDTFVEIIEGNFVFVEDSSSVLHDTRIRIAGGSLRFAGSSVHEWSTTNIDLFAGSLFITDDVNVLQSSGSISIAGGDLIVEGNAIFEMHNTAAEITSGSALFNGGAITWSSSSLNVRGGSISFSGSVIATIEDGSLSLSGRGQFLVADNSILNVIGSNYTIAGGETTYTDAAHVSIIHSHFSVHDGDVYFAGNSEVTLSENSIYEVTGGNVFTSGTSILNLLENSCFVIAQGSVSYEESNVLQVLNSCWNVTGGNVKLNNNVEYLLSSNSVLHIEAGSFVTKDTTKILIDNSKVIISGGDFNIFDESSVVLTRGSVDVSNGNALFAGSVSTEVISSKFTVSGGHVVFSGNADLQWKTSGLTVSSGDLAIQGNSQAKFHKSNVLISGGSVYFRQSSNVTVDSTSFDIHSGNANFDDEAIALFIDSTMYITEGQLQFGGNSFATFEGGLIQLTGHLRFVERSNSHFMGTKLSILGGHTGGNFKASDDANILFQESQVEIGGDMITTDRVNVRMEDSEITIDDGDLEINDLGSFNVIRSSLVINSGNLIAQNFNTEERKEILFTQSQITVARSVHDTSNLVGHVQIHENVDLAFHASDVLIDGDLVMTGASRLFVVEESSFVIPTGVVELEESCEIFVDASSALLNQGQLVAPGSVRAPRGSSMRNEGLLESDHDLNANCFSDIEEGAPIENTGTFRLGNEAVSNSCIDNLDHNGLMQLGSVNVTFNQIATTRESTTTLSGSRVALGRGNRFDSRGSVGGSGEFAGSFSNDRNAVIMANGEHGASSIEVDEDFESSGTMYFVITSRDLTQEGAITQVNAGRNVAFDGGHACVCLDPTLKFKDGDKFDLVNAQKALSGKFDKVEFDCVECPRRNAKSIEASGQCEPSSNYGGTSFSVLFDACSGDGDYLDNITPPYYVIVPVAFTIVASVVVFFGGALLLEKKYRERKIKQKNAAKAAKRKDRVRQQLSTRSDTM